MQLDKFSHEITLRNSLTHTFYFFLFPFYFLRFLTNEGNNEKKSFIFLLYTATTCQFVSIKIESDYHEI